MDKLQDIKKSSAYMSIRRKFYQSVLKWSVDDSVHEEEKLPDPPDVSDLVNILRAIGFKLRQFDKCDNNMSITSSTSSLNIAVDAMKNAECKVEITCGHSGLRAVLESVVGECRCPPVESAKQAEFWQMSGSAPTSKGSQESLCSIQEAGSSLVPPLPPAVAVVVKDIMSRLLHIVCEPETSDLDISTRSFSGKKRLSGGSNTPHHRSLDTLHLSLTQSSSKNFDSASEMMDCGDLEQRKFSRTISNVELATCPISPVSGSPSFRDPVKGQEASWTGLTVPHLLPSPISNLSTSLEKITISEKRNLFFRLEVANRSICEAMSILQPLKVPTPKVGIEKTSSPKPGNKSGLLKKPARSPTACSTLKACVTPEPLKRASESRGSAKKTAGTPGLLKKTTVVSKKMSKIPEPPRLTPRSASVTSVICSKSDLGKTAIPSKSEASTAAALKIKKKASRPLSVTPCALTSQKHIGTSKNRATLSSSDKISTPCNISSGSSSSASSATSKSRILMNAVRRVSRLSSAGSADSPKSCSKGDNISSQHT